MSISKYVQSISIHAPCAKWNNNHEVIIWQQLIKER